MMHVFRFLAIMSLLAPFAYASDSAALREELPAWLIESEEEPELTQQQKDAVEEAAQLLLKTYRIVQGINDLATANAAAPELREIAQRADELDKLGTPIWLVVAKFEEYGGSRVQAEIYGQRIANNGFYGSRALAEVIGAPESAVFELATPTPEFLAELGEEIKSTMVAMFPAVTGGPGFDEKTAWRISAQSKYEAAMFAAVLPADCIAEDAGYVQENEDSALFWVMNYRLQRGGKMYCLSLWVDVTVGTEVDITESDE